MASFQYEVIFSIANVLWVKHKTKIKKRFLFLNNV